MNNIQKLAQVKKISSQHGVVLLEALIALLIFSMGILALVGLQVAMVKNTSDNKYRADASFIAQERLGRMWGDPTNLASYAGTTTLDSSILPNATTVVVVQSRGLVTVTVTWQVPGGDPHSYTTSTYIG